MRVDAFLILFLLLTPTVRAADPVAPVRPAATTNYFAIDAMPAKCCAVMLQHALTNLAGVKRAEVFPSNQLVRVVHQPDAKTLKQIRRAFRTEIVEAKRLDRVPAFFAKPLTK